MTQILLVLLIAVVPSIIAITLHEAAHGYAALALGDDTARKMGRLSLNPLRHVDPVGTLLLPGILLLGQLLTIGRVVFMFGWAKPVPVSAWRFRNPRRGMAIVAAAGPAMNFFLAWLGALALHASELLADVPGEIIDQMLQLFVLANLVLGLFNLLPLPPLDGGRIVVGILPEPLASMWARLERGGLVLVLLIVFILPRFLPFDPVGRALNTVVPWATNLVYTLAGWHGGG